MRHIVRGLASRRRLHQGPGHVPPGTDANCSNFNQGASILATQARGRGGPSAIAQFQGRHRHMLERRLGHRLHRSHNLGHLPAQVPGRVLALPRYQHHKHLFTAGGQIHDGLLQIRARSHAIDRQADALPILGLLCGAPIPIDVQRAHGELRLTLQRLQRPPPRALPDWALLPGRVLRKSQSGIQRRHLAHRHQRHVHLVLLYSRR
mmetsp:Transcript_24971/g.60542  ORF Transcript_24971/g.60542 Transcript_24971/m.60542 type:complete len:206 (+) Transcript_24971:185-802(+)